MEDRRLHCTRHETCIIISSREYPNIHRNGDYSMNKNELLEKVSLASGLTKKESEAAINAFLETLTDVLKAGDKISLKGFGTFEVRTREARMVRNPRTGETMEIAASKVPAFKASSALKNVVNGK